MRRALVVAAVVVSGAAVFSPSVRADTVGDILSQMKDTQKKLADLDGKLKENQAQKDKNEARENEVATEFSDTVKPLDQKQKDASDAASAASARAEADYQEYAQQCPEGYPAEQQQACESRYAQYDSLYQDFTRQKNDAAQAYQAYSDAFDKFDADRKEVLQAEDTRVAEAKQLLADEDAAQNQMKFLQARLNMAKIDKKSRDCLGLDTNEAIVNCLSNQWDGTQRTNLYVPDPPQGLTQEQVIERYKNSGKPTGPQTLKTKEPPPPPTSK